MGINTSLSNVAAYARLLELLVDMPLTTHELAAESGLGTNTVRKLVAMLRRPGRRRLRIVVWRKDKLGRYTLPAYQWSQQPDVLRPPALSPTERSRNRRVRNRMRLSTADNHPHL